MRRRSFFFVISSVFETGWHLLHPTQTTSAWLSGTILDWLSIPVVDRVSKTPIPVCCVVSRSRSGPGKRVDLHILDGDNCERMGGGSECVPSYIDLTHNLRAYVRELAGHYVSKHVFQRSFWAYSVWLDKMFRDTTLWRVQDLNDCPYPPKKPSPAQPIQW
ncbi:hypothetical protein BDV06DRAFT_181584 [Aspergillus oleicola]